ncbi:MAG: 50S ribosomal protein L15 [Candidatus Latescibacteria bacterium]|nr:50S ribosomal protein L15 [Candidatus Latescibacterota bacterium]
MRIGQIKPARGATRVKKRRGMGPASGLGGTAGRGHKGQRARSGSGSMVARWFEGGQMPIQRRLPKRGFRHIQKISFQVVNVASLERFSEGEAVNRESLKAKRLIDRGNRPVKLLAEGEVKSAYRITVDAVSAAARAKIEAAGGTITLPKPKSPRPRRAGGASAGAGAGGAGRAGGPGAGTGSGS